MTILGFVETKVYFCLQAFMEEVSSSVMLWIMITKKADASLQMLKFCTNTGEEIMTHYIFFFLSASCILKFLIEKYNLHSVWKWIILVYSYCTYIVASIWRRNFQIGRKSIFTPSNYIFIAYYLISFYFLTNGIEILFATTHRNMSFQKTIFLIWENLL